MEHYIKKIDIDNFKSIKELKLNGCKKINIFAGRPNAGKSNILEALSLFDVFFNPQNLRNFVRYGKNSDLFFEGSTREFIRVYTNRGGIIISSVLDELNMAFGNASTSALEEFREFSIKGDTDRRKAVKRKSPNIKKYCYKELENIKENRSGYLASPFGENIGQMISSNMDIRGFVNHFLSQNHLKLLIERGTNELKIFKEYEDGTVFSLPYNMIADTLQRLIFYKTAIMSNEKSILLFEEPEAHCFEPYILEITNEIKYNKNENQFFIVTHSDFIIQEFLRDEESRNEVQIYLVNNEKGGTKVKKIDAEKNEDVYEYGMNIFFNFDTLWEKN